MIINRYIPVPKHILLGPTQKLSIRIKNSFWTIYPPKKYMNDSMKYHLKEHV